MTPLTPKSYTVGNIIIKIFFLAFVIVASIGIIHFVTKLIISICEYLIDWKVFRSFVENYILLWIILIFAAGFSCGVVMMALFHKPDSAEVVNRLGNPAAMARLFMLLAMKVRLLKWQEYFENIDFNFLRK